GRGAAPPGAGGSVARFVAPTTAGRPTWPRYSRSCVSPSSAPRRASTRRATPRNVGRSCRYPSTSGPQLRRSASEPTAKPYPGRSASTKRSFTRKKLICRVRPGVPLVRARPRRPRSAFRSDDLPTFERPAIATSGPRGDGPPPGAAAAPRNRAAVIFTQRSACGLRGGLLVEAERLVDDVDLPDIGLAQR